MKPTNELIDELVTTEWNLREQMLTVANLVVSICGLPKFLKEYTTKIEVASVTLTLEQAVDAIAARVKETGSNMPMSLTSTATLQTYRYRAIASEIQGVGIALSREQSKDILRNAGLISPKGENARGGNKNKPKTAKDYLADIETATNKGLRVQKLSKLMAARFETVQRVSAIQNVAELNAVVAFIDQYESEQKPRTPLKAAS